MVRMRFRICVCVCVYVCVCENDSRKFSVGRQRRIVLRLLSLIIIICIFIAGRLFSRFVLFFFSLLFGFGMCVNALLEYLRVRFVSTEFPAVRGSKGGILETGRRVTDGMRTW